MMAAETTQIQRRERVEFEFFVRANRFSFRVRQEFL